MRWRSERTPAEYRCVENSRHRSHVISQKSEAIGVTKFRKMDYNAKAQNPSNYESVNFERPYNVKSVAWGPQTVTSAHFEMILLRTLGTA